MSKIESSQRRHSGIEGPTVSALAHSRARGLALNLLVSLGAFVLFFGGIEVVLGLAGVRPLLDTRDPYVGFQSSIRLFEVSESGATLKTAPNKLEFFNRQEFPRQKATGTRRVFSLGGSTTYGRPYDDRTSYSAWLREYLSVVDPLGRWEVINAGGISYASYRVALLMEELVEYEPDLFIIYSGNNEFLERRTYPKLMDEPVAMTTTRLLLQRSRLWALGRSLTERGDRRAYERYEMQGEVNELLNHSAGLDYYHRDELFEKQVLDHYRFNLRRMVSLARASGAKVILVTVPVNERDFSPFKSEHREGLARKDRIAVEGLLEEAEVALEHRDWVEAARATDRALEIDPLYAKSHFFRGRALMGIGDQVEADRSFATAVAEDVCPLRALEEINNIIVETAEELGTGLVDFRELLKRAVEERSGYRSLGDETFLDHVHPTVDSHGELAVALIDEMESTGLLHVRADWRDSSQMSIGRAIRSRVSPELTAAAHKNLAKVLIWAGKGREAEKYIGMAEQALQDDWEIHFNAATVAMRERGDHETARRKLEMAIELRPDSARAHDLLAMTYVASGEMDKATEAALRAVQLDPSMAMAWSNLAIIHRQQGKLEQALEAALRAIDLEPDSAEASNNLGTVYFVMNRLPEALAAYQRAIALREDFLGAKTNAGLTLGALERYEEAKAYFRDVVATNPETIVAQLGLGQTLIITGEPRAALEHLEKVLELAPRSAKALELKALALQDIAAAGRS